MDMLSASLKAQGFGTYITTSHPAMMRALNHSRKWAMIRKPSRIGKASSTSKPRLMTSRNRITTTFKFQAEADDTLLDILAPKPNTIIKT